MANAMMAWTRMLLDFLRGVAWPVAGVSIAVLLRDRVATLLDRVIGLEFPGVARATLAPASQESLRPPGDVESSESEDVLDREGEEEEEDEVVTLMRELFFERVYNRIFGGQIDILERTAHPVPRGQLESWYETTRGSRPGLEDWGLDDYLRFLEASQMIADEPPGWLRRTEVGTAFLTYLDENGYTRLRPL